jgi:hypothetical protein
VTGEKQSLIDPDSPVPRKEFEALKAEMKRPPWPMDYLGDEMYVKLSRLMDELLLKRIAITLRDLRADQWVQESTNLVDSLRWTRFVRQFLMKRHVPFEQRGRGQHRYPFVKGARRIVEFQVPASGPPILYAAYADEMHCAISVAVGRERISKSRKAQVIRRLREDVNATDSKACVQCQIQLRLAGEFSNTNSNAGSRVQGDEEKGGDVVSKTAPALLSSTNNIVVISSSRETNFVDSSLARRDFSPLDGQPDAVTSRVRLSRYSSAIGDVGITDNEQRDRRE